MDGFSYFNIFETKGIEYMAIIAFLALLIPFWFVLNKQVKIQGTLIKATTLKEDFTVLAIKSFNNSEKIEAVCNCPNLKNYINQNLSIIGKISEYNNHLQIKVDKISLLK